MRIWVFCIFATVVAAEQFNGDQLVDEVLSVIKIKAERSIESNVAYLPFFKMYDIKCTSGKFGNLSEIYRTGNTTVTNEGGRLTLNTSLGIEGLHIFSDFCPVVGELELAGIRVAIESNSFNFVLSLKCEDNKCIGKIDDVSVEKFQVKHVINDDSGLSSQFKSGYSNDPTKIQEDVKEMLRHFADSLCLQ